jgi:alpha-galactosidase
LEEEMKQLRFVVSLITDDNDYQRQQASAAQDILVEPAGRTAFPKVAQASLLTNPEVIAVDQHSTGNHQVIATNKTSVWLAQPVSGKGHYVAAFNLEDAAATVQYAWSDLGLSEKEDRLRDLWEHKDLGLAHSIKVTVPPHGAVLYSVSPKSEEQ